MVIVRMLTQVCVALYLLPRIRNGIAFLYQLFPTLADGEHYLAANSSV